MKKWVAIILCCIIICSMTACGRNANMDELQQKIVNYANIKRADSFAGGDGTAQSPYQISTVEQLARLADIGDDNTKDEELGMDYEERKTAMSAYYVLTDDIVINDTSAFDNWKNEKPANIWKPINRFKGSFDGQGHCVTGMYVTGYSTSDGQTGCGLFGSTDGAFISNLIIDNAFVTCESTGGVVVCNGRNTGINNCQVLNAYIGCRHNAGGIVGDGTDCSISDCEVDGEIIAGSNLGVGGIAGQIMDSNIKNCISHVCINAEPSDDFPCAGGIVGTSYNDAKIEECSFDGVIKGNINAAGGICGEVHAGKNTSIQYCENAGTIGTDSENGVTMFGGICGEVYKFEKADNETEKEVFTQIDNCTNNGVFNNAVKVNDVGGILGYTHMETGEIKITNCSNFSDIVNAEYAGGILGDVSILGKGNLTLENLENKGNIYGDRIGGIGGNVTCAPWNDSADGYLILRNCSNEGTLSANKLAGGLFCSFMPGLSEETPIGSYEIENCSSTGDYPYFAQTDSVDILARKLVQAIVDEYGMDVAKEWVKTSFPEYEFED